MEDETLSDKTRRNLENAREALDVSQGLLSKIDDLKEDIRESQKRINYNLNEIGDEYNSRSTHEQNARDDAAEKMPHLSIIRTPLPKLRVSKYSIDEQDKEYQEKLKKIIDEE